MSATHPIRIGRAARTRAVRVAGPGAVAPAPSGAPDVRENRGGTRRALRVGLLFVGVLVVLYATLLLYDRTTPGGTSSGSAGGVLLFSAVALAIGAGGFLVSVGVAPRRVELRPDATVVVGRFGRRREFPRDGSYSARVVRRFPASPIAPEPAVSLELSSNGVRRTYLVEADLVPTP